jgi:hypothetical protein
VSGERSVEEEEEEEESRRRRREVFPELTKRRNSCSLKL